MAFGLTETGFNRKRLDDIKSEIQDSLKGQFGPYINLLPASVFSQIVGIYAEREASVWELSEDVYNSQFPDTAEGVALDNAVSYGGILRLIATKSKISNVALFGTAGTLVPAGTVFSVAGSPTSRFVTDADVTLGTGVNEVQLIAFSLVPTVGTFKLTFGNETTSAIGYNATATDIQTAINALNKLSGVTVTGNFTIGFTLNFAGVDAKTDESLLGSTANTLISTATPVAITITQTVQGSPDGSVSVTAENTGPVYANAGTLTVIATPVSGLNSVTNPLDAVAGQNRESDAALRARRTREIQIAGAGTVEAIRSRLLSIDGVTDVIVFENTSYLAVSGRPPKSFEAVVNGGLAQSIVDMIWLTKPAGIESYGNQTGTALDSLGSAHTIKWSRPTSVNIYLSLDITVLAGAPASAATLVRDALVAYGNSVGIGKNVIVYPRLVSVLNQFPWLVDVVVRIGRNPAPTTDDNVVIAPNEIPAFDTSRTTVTVLP